MLPFKRARLFLGRQLAAGQGFEPQTLRTSSGGFTLMPAKPPPLASRACPGPSRGPLRGTWLLRASFLTLLLCCSPDCVESAAATAVASAAAAAAALLLPLPVQCKKVFGIARGGKFEAIGDFCFTVPPGSSGALVAETVRCMYTWALSRTLLRSTRFYNAFCPTEFFKRAAAADTPEAAAAIAFAAAAAVVAAAWVFVHRADVAAGRTRAVDTLQVCLRRIQTSHRSSRGPLWCIN